MDQRNTTIGSEGTITIQSGGTTTLKGAQVKGDRVEVEARNLHIESVQDTSTYQGKQTGGSIQVTVGAGWGSVSGSFNQSKIDSEYASVNNQTGIIAGDGGYRINVIVDLFILGFNYEV